MIPLEWNLEHPLLLVAWVAADGVRVADSAPELAAELDATIADPDRHGLDEATRTGIRDLLRGHGYKPSGRGKPASEFLVGAAERGAFPRINNVVDINNLVSLETGWPISVFDLDAARPSGERLEVRLGAPGESFVFNPAGQSIDIGGLIVVGRAGGAAIGNPVKDSMETKIEPATRRVLAVLYTSRALAEPARAEAAARRYGDLLRAHTGAAEVRTGLLAQDRPAPGPVDATRPRD